jgi:hypothetical protein
LSKNDKRDAGWDPFLQLRVDKVLSCDVDFPDIHDPTITVFFRNDEQAITVKLTPGQTRALGKALTDAVQARDSGEFGTFGVCENGVIKPEALNNESAMKAVASEFWRNHYTHLEL